MTDPWHRRKLGLADAIRADLRALFPNLHLLIDATGRSEVRGTYPVCGIKGEVLDRFQVVIELLPDYPKSLPVVREVGGRIPWSSDYHIEPDGKACILLPEDRWRCFPEGAPFIQFLRGPVRDFFLGQSLVALGEPWPFGEWGHGREGIIECYKELFETEDARTIGRTLQILSKLSFKRHWLCPCGSGKKIRNCCDAKIADLRRKIPPAIARRSVEKLRGN